MSKSKSKGDNSGGNGSRLDRELMELLNELRVALPGVQVLFAFLLTVPFTQRFRDLSPLQTDLYFVVLSAAAVASVLLIAPSAYHRINWRQHDKEHLLKTSNRLVIVGMGFLALAMSLAVFLIADLIFSRRWAVVSVSAVGFLFALFWFVLPVIRNIRNR